MAKKTKTKAQTKRATQQREMDARLRVHRAQAAKNKRAILFGAKASFVRGLPRSMPAAEVIRQAWDEAGLRISKAYVHNIRSAAGKESRRLAKLPRLIDRRPGTAEEFEKIVIAMGPARARKLLDKVEAALKASK